MHTIAPSAVLEAICVHSELCVRPIQSVTLTMANRTCDPITVLLVDDQRFVGTALQRLLSSEADIALHCCHISEEAIPTATQLMPTVILQDLVMPGINGLTLIGLLRRNPITAATPVIALSGNDDDETRQQALAAGASDYLIKLPAKADLIECIRRQANHVNPVQPASDAHPEGDGPVEQTLDPAVLATFREAGDGDPDLMLSLLDQYLHEAESRLATLADAAGRLDVKALKTTAHSLKGSSLVMGANRMAALCRRLEDDLRGAAHDAIAEPALGPFNEELVRLRQAVAAERSA
jgi:CheY-like chemotaxis protein